MNNGIYELPQQFATAPYGLLGRPTPVPMPNQFWHPEAIDWQNRVRLNGGTVSITTLAAVSEFCVSIDAAGMRDRLYRVNLFCGNSLNAALVPLYLAQSPSAAPLGNRTEMNVNFVSRDFIETGASGGMTCNGGKYLRTGFSTSLLPNDGLFHASLYFSSITNTQYCFGATGNVSTTWAAPASSTAMRWSVGAAAFSDAPATVATLGMFTMARLANSYAFARVNLSAPNYNFSNVNPASLGRDTVDLPVFARFAVGAGYLQAISGRGCAYSIGTPISEPQSVIYRNIMQSFQQRLGRSV